MKMRTKVCGAVLLAVLGGLASQIRVETENFRLIKRYPYLSREDAAAINSWAPFVQSRRIRFRKKLLIHYVKITNVQRREVEYKIVAKDGTIETTLGRLNPKTGEYK